MVNYHQADFNHPWVECRGRRVMMIVMHDCKFNDESSVEMKRGSIAAHQTRHMRMDHLLRGGGPEVLLEGLRLRKTKNSPYYAPPKINL